MTDKELADCRRIESTEERVTCYDAIVDADAAPYSTNDGKAGSRPDISATDTSLSAKSLFGTNDSDARRIVEKSLAIEQLEHIKATVADVQESPGQKPILALENGQIWRQIDSKTLHLKSGDAVVIRKASLSSFLLEKASGSRRIRVRRID
ncbi:MAG: hypothetical protein QNJ14_09590 [Woeseiaceae bacterium]|nr:hypothetical protein [Woeseiaceae bacterium]